MQSIGDTQNGLIAVVLGVGVTLARKEQEPWQSCKRDEIGLGLVREVGEV